MIVWRGKGIFVVLIVFLSSLFSELATNRLFGLKYWNEHQWSFGLSLVMSGLFVFTLHLALREKPRVLVDEQTGERLVFAPSNELFWIPIKYWGPILGAIGLIVIIKDLSGPTM